MAFSSGTQNCKKPYKNSGNSEGRIQLHITDTPQGIFKTIQEVNVRVLNMIQ